MLIDLHVHTTHGSSDSSLRLERLIEEAVRAGLDGVCVTEHSTLWLDDELTERASGSGIHLYPALEVETDMGHVLMIGGNGYVSGIHRMESLAEHAAREGAALVLAHPFRHYTDPSPGQSCILTDAVGLDNVSPATAAVRLGSGPSAALSLVHAVETVNGATRESDNEFAAKVAAALRIATTGGSDAHSAHGIGSGVTEFSGRPRTSAELAEALREGKSRAAYRSPAGKLRYPGPAAPDGRP